MAMKAYSEQLGTYEIGRLDRKASVPRTAIHNTCKVQEIQFEIE